MVQLGRGAVVGLTALCQALNILVTAEMFHRGYKSPLQLNYACLMWYIVLGLPRIVANLRHESNAASSAALAPVDDGNTGVQAEPRGSSSHVSPWRSYRGSHQLCGVAPAWATEVAVLAGLYVCYVTANVCFVVAVAKMNAGIVTSIFSTMPVWVCGLSVVLLGRRLVWPEALAVVCSIAGMLCISEPWKASGVDAVATACAIVAPLAAASYNVLFARVFTDVGWREVGFILSKLVVFNATLGTAILALALSGFAGRTPPVEAPIWSYDAPRTSTVIALFIASGATGLGFNFFVNYAVTITYPLFVSVGSVLSTVVVLAGTVLLHKQWPVGVQWPGIVLVGAGFALLVWNDWRASREQTAHLQDTDGADGCEVNAGSSERTTLLS